MDLEVLAEGLYDDSNGLITCVRLLANGDLSIELECDDWKVPDVRRHFTLICKDHLASKVCVGGVSSVSLHQVHPLLLERSGKQGGLYFSSRPPEPEKVYAEIWEALSHEYRGWVDPSMVIGRSPSSFRTLLNGGYGLLVTGPMSVLASVQKRLKDALTTQLIETHTTESNAVILVFDKQYVICGEIEVAENAA
jgi:hypothetical protein